MQPKDLKHLEVYLYSQVVLPLQQLGQLPALSSQTPLTSDVANYIAWIRRDDLENSYDHNYQRNDARERLHDGIYMGVDGGYESFRIGDHDPKTHNVTLYTGIAKETKYGMVVLRQLEKLFSSTYPFNKVTVEE